MRITSVGYIDAGFAIGYDDRPFQVAASKELLSPDLCFHGTNRLGNGIVLHIADADEILSGWKQGAQQVFTDNDYRQGFPMSEITEELLRELFADKNICYELQLTLHSCGIVIVEFTIDKVADTINATDVIRFAQLFEYAAYGYYHAQTDFQMLLRAIAREVLASYSASDNPIQKITVYESHCKLQIRDILPSFTLVFHNTRLGFLDELTHYCHTHQNITSDVSFNEQNVVCSWYIWGCATTDADNCNMLISSLKLYTLYYGAAESCEKLLSTLISKLMMDESPQKLSSNKEKREISYTILLQTIGNIVVNNTELQVSTQNGEFKALFERMDASGNISAFHNSIIRSIQVISDIQQQLQHKADLKTMEEEKRQDLKINKFVVGITAFTFISVIADLFNLDQYSSLLISRAEIRILIYITLLACLITFIYKLFNSPGQKKQ